MTGGRPYFTWRAEWTLEVPFMDEDHRALASMLNQVAERFWDGRYRDPGERDERLAAELEQALIELALHTRAHFEREEAVMRELGYPHFESHEREHRLLLGELAELTRSLRRRGVGWLDGETLDALKSWLMGHVLDDDQELATFIRRCEGDLPEFTPVAARWTEPLGRRPPVPQMG